MNGTVPASWPRTTRLWNANFFLLWQGQLVSQLGTQAAFVATMLWTLESTGSPGLMALLLMTSSLPAVMLGPIAGTVVDRHSRKRLIIGADVTGGLAALTVGRAMLLRPTSTDSIVAFERTPSGAVRHGRALRDGLVRRAADALAGTPIPHRANQLNQPALPFPVRSTRTPALRTLSHCSDPGFTIQRWPSQR